MPYITANSPEPIASKTATLETVTFSTASVPERIGESGRDGEGDGVRRDRQPRTDRFEDGDDTSAHGLQHRDYQRKNGVEPGVDRTGDAVYHRKQPRTDRFQTATIPETVTFSTASIPERIRRRQE